jgi:hypothetical protein
VTSAGALEKQTFLTGPRPTAEIIVQYQLKWRDSVEGLRFCGQFRRLFNEPPTETLHLLELILIGEECQEASDRDDHELGFATGANPQ